MTDDELDDRIQSFCSGMDALESKHFYGASDEELESLYGAVDHWLANQVLARRGKSLATAVRVSANYDEKKDEWFLRLHNGDNYAGICAANGREEAEAIQRVLQGAIELHYSLDAFDYSQSFRRGMANANNMAEGRLLIELAS